MRNTSIHGMVEAEENFLIDFQLLVQDLLNKKGLSRSDLAKAAGLSKARLSQILRADANPTMKTCARLLSALGEKASVGISEKSGVRNARQESVTSEGGAVGEWLWHENAIQLDTKPRGDVDTKPKGSKVRLAGIIRDTVGAPNDSFVVTLEAEVESLEIGAA